MINSILEAKSQEVRTLDAVTQEIIGNIEKNDRRARLWGAVLFFAFSILLAIGVVGIYYQNRISNSNKKHIDCIVKLFVTPLPGNAQHKIITDPGEACNIEFTK